MQPIADHSTAPAATPSDAITAGRKSPDSGWPQISPRTAPLCRVVLITERATWHLSPMRPWTPFTP